MRINDLELERLLLAEGMVTPAELDGAHAALPVAEEIKAALVTTGAISEERLYRFVAERSGVRFAKARELLAIADPAAEVGLSRRFLEAHRLVVIGRRGPTAIVAGPDFDQTWWPDVASALAVERLEPVMVTPTDYQTLRGVLHLHLRDQAEGPAGQTVWDLTARPTDSSPVAMVDAALLGAISNRASDIHLEHTSEGGRLRFRIDGDLRDLPRGAIDHATYLAVVNVVKTRADLDIAEHRVPQGGRFAVRAGSSRFDVRVQTQPALHGEHLVLRLLPQGHRPLPIEKLGFTPTVAQVYERLLDAPHGLILVVGPTGSGKSTTLYAGVQRLASDTTRKVITIEDPIEYAIAGVQQSKTAPQLGFGFAQAMRAFVREDPDVIMLGEIRDGETALEAIRASQTGHLVLSTLHCGESVEAIQRLLDLGIHPNSIASELAAVFAQQLAKRICGACRVLDPAPDPALLAEVFPEGLPSGFKTWRGAGCPQCDGVGTRGRIAVIEYLPVESTLKSAISGRAPLHELRTTAIGAGLRPMRDEALALVGDGIIALSELRAILPPPRLGPEAPFVRIRSVA